MSIPNLPFPTPTQTLIHIPIPIPHPYPLHLSPSAIPAQTATPAPQISSSIHDPPSWQPKTYHRPHTARFQPTNSSSLQYCTGYDGVFEASTFHTAKKPHPLARASERVLIRPDYPIARLDFQFAWNSAGRIAKPHNLQLQGVGHGLCATRILGGVLVLIGRDIKKGVVYVLSRSYEYNLVPRPWPRFKSEFHRPEATTVQRLTANAAVADDATPIWYSRTASQRMYHLKGSNSQKRHKICEREDRFSCRKWLPEPACCGDLLIRTFATFCPKVMMGVNRERSNPENGQSPADTVTKLANITWKEDTLTSDDFR
ncbi:hypothetical protein PAAG_00502 [Paracoccidioides lutzii Pb01]|uniref:Uncharacterized protein n=1 Tax=Paracoccidioides lutzii (strain ATCC MYA-826 / Pb01) TaxID=502779 RepID=C1GPQ7_PARBA|nr:hypothetical protein PAAG_00502 [Paracoccidioides lutzii Pb01]EEH36179.2 hypothetical protein PAAG_00502 [Paracoccidioides lutzii Pb01]